ncbi:MAG TPA: DUF4253 domain-containing protein [Candidatus Sulfotelmatobacter sp.]|nr:DUF4253 domain-containing protein [Candidatus Sulfotelmatobacter sp.]
MGLFDRFKKQPGPPESKPSEKNPAELVFQPSMSCEIAPCRGELALQHLEQLREAGNRSGFTVILLGGEGDTDSLEEERDASGPTPEEYVRRAAELDVDKWLAERVAQDPEQFSSEMGRWPLIKPKAGSIMAHLDILSGRPKDVVYIAKIPTSLNWQAPAYIGAGGWNECPDAAVLAALARRWHERFGAEFVSITHDTIEFLVANPPASKEQAIELAKEQFIVCSDIVTQGTDTISALAATLLNSNYWYFWWD